MELWHTCLVNSVPVSDAFKMGHSCDWTLIACVAGSDPEKLKLSAALPVIFNKCKTEYQSRPDMTGAELYDFVLRCAVARFIKLKHNLCNQVLSSCGAANPAAYTEDHESVQ